MLYLLSATRRHPLDFPEKKHISSDSEQEEYGGHRESGAKVSRTADKNTRKYGCHYPNGTVEAILKPAQDTSAPLGCEQRGEAIADCARHPSPGRSDAYEDKRNCYVISEGRARDCQGNYESAY